MGRNKLTEDIKKEQRWIYVESKIVNFLTRERVKQIAEDAVNRYYKKQLKNG